MTIFEAMDLSYLRGQMRIPSAGSGLRALLGLEQRLHRSQDGNEFAHVEFLCRNGFIINQVFLHCGLYAVSKLVTLAEA